MNKKLLALALAALPVAAFADSSNVVVYGTLNATFERSKAEGAVVAAGNQPSFNRVTQQSSNIGFKGTEDLGNGLKAIFQVETGVSVDTGGSASSFGTWGTRNTNVGLTGNFGTVFFGNWDTPYKSASLRLDPMGGTTFSSSMFGAPGYGIGTYTGTSATTGAGAFSFHRRENNSVQYWTPNFSGISARLGYSTGESNSAATGLKPQLYSASVNYDNGPLYVYAATERHRDFGGDAMVGLVGAGALAGTINDTKDTAWALGAGFNFGQGTTIGAIYEQLKYEASTTTGASDEMKRKQWFIGATHQIGNTVLRAMYGKQRDPEVNSTVAGRVNAFDLNLNGSGAAEADAKQFTLAVGQLLSKRTEVYVAYTKIRNEADSRTNFMANVVPATLAANQAGADPQSFGIGIKHTF